MNGTPFSNDIKLHDSIGNIKTDKKQLANSALRNAKEFLDTALITHAAMVVIPPVCQLSLRWRIDLEGNAVSLQHYF